MWSSKLLYSIQGPVWEVCQSNEGISLWGYQLQISSLLHQTAAQEYWHVLRSHRAHVAVVDLSLPLSISLIIFFLEVCDLACFSINIHRKNCKVHEKNWDSSLWLPHIPNLQILNPKVCELSHALLDELSYFLFWKANIASPMFCYYLFWCPIQP